MPPKNHNKEWHVIVRTTVKVPFGYEVHPENDKLLVPVEHELEALELAKQHLKQYSYRAVAHWLSQETGRYISHMGLKKRIEVEQKRRKDICKLRRKLSQVATKKRSRKSRSSKTRGRSILRSQRK